MHQLISSFVHNPVKVTVAVILVVLFGLISAAYMPMQLTPEVQIPTLTIETFWPGASPQEVEREIVQEQEEQLKSVEGVRKMSSECMDSMGRVILEFPVGTDMKEALLRVNTKLAQVPRYPEDADEPVISTSNASDRPIAWFILSQLVPPREKAMKLAEQHPELREELERVYQARSEGLQMFRLRALADKDPRAEVLLPPDRDVTTLRKFAEDYIEAAFERVEGVSNANVLGGREEEVQLVLDPERLAARNLTITDVRTALQRQNADTSGGDYWEGKRRYIVRTLGQFRSPEQVENAIIARRDGIPVYVRDVGYAQFGHKKPDGFVRRFGSNCIAINALRAVGANVLDVMEGLRQTNAELNETLLEQQGLQLIHVYDETDYIYSARNLVFDNLIYGSILTFFTLLLFLRNPLSTIVIFVHIVVSTIGAFMIMAVLGRSLNVPALGGLAFAVGMLVDNAIVMLENIYRRHEQGEQPEVASVNGANEVWAALLNATMANLAVFIPVLFVREEAGQLFRDIAIAISAAVAISMLVAVTVVPTVTMRLLKQNKRRSAKTAGRRSHRIVGGLMRPLDATAGAVTASIVGINAWLQKSVLLRLAFVFAVFGVSVALSWVLLPKVEYLPNGNRNLVIALIMPPPGYNLDQLTKMGEVVEEELRPYWDVNLDDPASKKLEYPAIDDFFYVARNRSVFVGVRSAEGLRASELVPLIQKVGDRLPGTFLVAKQASLFEQGLTSGRTIDIEITGPDINRLVALGGQMFGQLKGGPGAPGLMPAAQIRPNPSLDLSNPEVRVVPKWEQAADLGVSATELGYAVDTFIDGAYATDYFSGGDRIDLRLMVKDNAANSSQSLASIPVATPTGQLVPLSAVATIDLTSGPEQINHRTRQRAITLEVTPPPEMPLEAAMDLIANQLVKPLQESGQLAGGYRIALAGTADKLRSTWSSLWMNLALAVLLTYLLMAATFESWLYPFVIILTVPLGAVGGFVGLWLLNFYVLQPLDVLTMLGFIMLVGTVVNNPILIVEQSLIHIRSEGMPVSQAILESVRLRIRPIMMTTLGGLVGLLPLVIAPGAGSELYRGIGAVLLGGLLLSTLLTLIFVPALLSLTMELRAWLARLIFGRSNYDPPPEQPAAEVVEVAEELEPVRV